MKFEFSAGGIVVRQAHPERSRRTQNKFTKDAIEVLLCQHSQHHGWVFPKGLIGDHVKGEKKETTALREVKEETGVSGKILKELTPVTYWYHFEGQKIRKTVYYFLMEYVSGDTKNHDHEMENVEWLPAEDVEKRLSYSSDKSVWKEAEKMLKSL